MGAGGRRGRGRRAAAWFALTVAPILLVGAAPAPPPPTPLAAMTRVDVAKALAARSALDAVATPGGAANASDAALVATARRIGLDGGDGFDRVQCGGSQASATLNGTAFGAKLPSEFGAGGGAGVGPWPDRTCPAAAPTCGQAPVPANWPPAKKATDCWLCGGGDVAGVYKQEGDATLDVPTRCLTTARARAAGGWPRAVTTVDANGDPHVDGLGDERHAGVDWRCIGDAAHLFYWMQASGPLSETTRARVGPWRGDTLLNDTAPNGAPLVGSFLDAADVSKFVFPLAYSLSMLSYGAFVGPARDAYEADPARRADLLAIINHGARFVRAARYAPGALVAYTTAPGDLNASHAGFWGRAEDIGVPSDVGYLTPGKPSADIAGAMAAALAGAAYANVDGDAPSPDQMEAAASYVATAADLFEQGTKYPGLHTPYVDATLPLFYNSSSYHDDMALAATWMALMVGGADWSRILRSGYGSVHREGGHNATEAAAVAARATALALEAGTAPPRSAMEYWQAAVDHLNAFYSSRAAQTNLLSWDNVGTLAGSFAARLALASEVAELRASTRANFTSEADMVDHLTKPAQLAVLSWMATTKYVPARVIGPLPGFGTGVKYVGDGNLAIAYENAWGSARLMSATTALAMDLADLAAAMNKYDHRTAWRCWARSQARALVGRLPGHTRPFIDDASADGLTVVNATRAAPLIDAPARSSMWRSFVVGVGPAPPRYLSHRGASCPTDRGLPCDCASYVSAAPNPTTVYGALVGGPNSAKPNAPGFHGHLDDRTSYETNEPALDYNAGWLITTMALAGQQIDPTALDVLSSYDREFPVSKAAAASDADTWDACVDSGVGSFPTLPAAFAADVRNASARNIESSRFKPEGAGRLRTGGWQLDGLLLALVTAGVAAAYFLGNMIAAARAGAARQLWYDGAMRVAAARDDARMLAALRGLAQGGKGDSKRPGSRRHGARGASSLRFCPEAVVPDGSKFTALLAAAAGASPVGGGAVEWLLQAGADPKAVKADGWRDTALHYAAAAGSLRAVAALVAAAPDLATATNFAGRTPAVVARDCGHSKVAHWLDAAATAAAKKDAPLPALPGEVAAMAAASAAAVAEPLTESELAEAAAYAGRGFDGWGSPGVVPARGVTRFRITSVAASAAWLGYLLWRALRTLDESSTSKYAYSVIFWLTEAFGFIMWFPLVVALWRQVERKPRNLHRMLLSPTAAADRSERAGMLALELAAADVRSTGGSHGDLSTLARGHGSSASLMSLRAGSTATGTVATLYPSAAIIVACYSEPVDVIQPTVLAALMQDYPSDRFQVAVCCDDPRRTDVPDMVKALQKMKATTARALPHLACIVRPKVAGVTHHAKAGNINSALFASGVNADYVVVLDCDMVTDSRFLARTLGHFLERDPAVGSSGLSAASPEPRSPSRGGVPPTGLQAGLGGRGSVTDGRGSVTDGRGSVATRGSVAGAASVASADWSPGAALRWRRKMRAGFLQTPQSFVNVDAADALGHRSRLFYGPLQAGRDGADAVCCCGTGCVFDRAALVSIGGQSYGSITEDNNTSQALAASGFSSMYLDEKLQAGLAPDDIPGVFEQRLRWATGALQIWWRANPLRRPGMTATQRLLYYDTSAYPLLGLSTLILCFVPIVYLLSGITPFSVQNMWELLLAFGLFYILQRAALWVAHLSIDGGTGGVGVGVAGTEMLRTTQIGFWLAPCNVRALFAVIWTEFKMAVTCGRGGDLGFKVTKKAASESTAANGGGPPSSTISTASGDIELGEMSVASSLPAPPPPPPKPAAPPPRRWTHAMLMPALVAAARRAHSHTSSFTEALPYVWIHLIYYLALVAAAGVTIWRAVTGTMDAWAVAVTAAAFGWALLVAANMWPPLALLVPDFGIVAALKRWRNALFRTRSRRRRRPGATSTAATTATLADSVLGSTLGHADAAPRTPARRMGEFAPALRQASVLQRTASFGRAAYELAPTARSRVVWLIDLFVVGALVAAAVIDANRVNVLLSSEGFPFGGSN